jgi:hypothetical protein
MTQKPGGWQNKYCDAICRCINVRPKPKCSWLPGTKGDFYISCSLLARSEIKAVIDATKPRELDGVAEAISRHEPDLDQVSTLARSIDLTKQDDKVPLTGPWHIECIDDDSVFDRERAKRVPGEAKM